MRGGRLTAPPERPTRLPRARARRRAGYQRAETRPDPPVRRYHLGPMLSRRRRYADGAAREFAVAPGRLPAASTFARSVALVSGLCALVYEVVWMRLFTPVFGLSVYASTAVLCAFMGGLGLGSH